MRLGFATAAAVWRLPPPFLCCSVQNNKAECISVCASVRCGEGLECQPDDVSGIMREHWPCCTSGARMRLRFHARRHSAAAGIL